MRNQRTTSAGSASWAIHLPRFQAKRRVFDEVRREIEALQRPELAEYGDRFRRGIEQVLAVGRALMSDAAYALLRARSLAGSVIGVIVSAELVKQADGDPGRQDVAASWVDRRMIDLEGRTERIRRGTVDLLSIAASA